MSNLGPAASKQVGPATKGAVQSKLRFKKAPELLYRFPLRIDILHENGDQMLARYSSREADRHPMG
jgi:hypothetical protein